MPAKNRRKYNVYKGSLFASGYLKSLLFGSLPFLLVQKKSIPKEKMAFAHSFLKNAWINYSKFFPRMGEVQIQ